MNTRDNLKQKALLLLLLVAAGMAKAQSHEFAPVGAEWYYERLYREGWNLTGIAYDRFRSLRTVEINGWECKEIELFQNLDCSGVVNPHVEYYYIHQEGNQVYEVEDGQRYLMYDFDKEPGEYWLVPKYNDTIYVDDVDFIELTDGSYRKRMHTHPSNHIELWFHTVIEGIGMDKSLFPFFVLFGPPPCMNGYIRCYSEDGIPLIMSETECDFEIVSVDEQENNPLFQLNTLVENVLFVDFMGISNEMKHVRIADMTGKTIHVQETTDKVLSINLSNTPNGIYLVQIITSSQVSNKKIVKK